VFLTRINLSNLASSRLEDSGVEPETQRRIQYSSLKRYIVGNGTPVRAACYNIKKKIIFTDNFLVATLMITSYRAVLYVAEGDQAGRVAYPFISKKLLIIYSYIVSF
jgi:hypothetical protein